MKRIYTYPVPSEYIGRKVSEFLRNQGYSQQSLTFLRHADYESIVIDGMPFPMNHRLKDSEKILSVILIEEAGSQKIRVRLAFTHPITKEELLFTAALPNDMFFFV